MLGLELCPFAAPVLRDGSLRIAVSEAADPAARLQAFLGELDALQRSSETEISTTLLVYACGPDDFHDFLALVESADALLLESGLDGLLQLAHFHPRYQFAGEAESSLSHFTNRSPLPTLHLLRESMMTRLLASYPDPESIPVRNTQRLERLGAAAVAAKWAALSD